MMEILGFLAVPLGYVMRFVYKLVNNYLLAIFLFTLLMRILMFPLTLQSQKKQADRIRLSPRLERLQKKYQNDPRKLQEKQQALYEKEGVSLTPGCLPMIIQMIVLFGIIAVIYKPLTYLTTDLPKDAVSASLAAVNVETYTKDGSGYTVNGDKTVATITVDGKTRTVDLTTKRPDAEVRDVKNNYYNELNMMKVLDENRDDILFEIKKAGHTEAEAEKYYDRIAGVRSEFVFGKYSLLEKPWSGWNNITLLWLIPLLSGLTAVLSSLISSYYTRQGTGKEKQPGQGCSNLMLVLFMPLFSVYIAFIVPGGVGVYWICSNLIALLQTVVVNMIYNPKKIREQAEKDYEERRRLRAEMKAKQNTLADARRLDDERERLEDEAAAAKAAAEAEEKAAGKPADKKKKKERPLNLEVGELQPDEAEDET